MTTEGVNYMGNFKGPQNQVYGNTYNPSWRNHPNLSWGNQRNNQWRPLAPPGFGGQNVQQPQPQFQQDKGSSFRSLMESKIEKFMDVMSSKMNQQDEAQKRMKQMIRNHSSSIHNLEVQMG